MECPVYVPVSGELSHIHPGSGVVGEPGLNGLLLLHFEGNQTLFPRFAQRVQRAADRQVHRYPTIARCSVQETAVKVVGVWDGWEVLIHDPGALARWLNVEHLDLAQLHL